MQLQQFDKKTVTSVEKEMRSGPAEETVVTDETLELKEQTELTDWVKVTLGQKVAKVKTTSKLESHPCVVTVEEMSAARHFIKTQGTNFTEEQRYGVLSTACLTIISHDFVAASPSSSLSSRSTRPTLSSRNSTTCGPQTPSWLCWWRSNSLRTRWCLQDWWRTPGRC